MTKKAWIIVIVLCVGILGGLIWISRSSKVDVSKVDSNTIQVGSAANGNIADHVTGKSDSKVVLFEYGAHPNAFAAASSAEAAGLQGKFWEMHDYLYSNRDSWVNLTGQGRTDYFVAAAQSIGLNAATFTSQLTDPNIKKKIDFDVALGNKAVVTGTPSFFIDGKNVGDQYFADGKLVASTVSGAQTIWSDADAFGTFVIEPALKAHGISVSNN